MRINYNNVIYTRESNTIGDVDNVRYYYNTSDDTHEVYSQELLDELENVYENICLVNITPKLFFI
jgi:hypothetical protein